MPINATKSVSGLNAAKAPVANAPVKPQAPPVVSPPVAKPTVDISTIPANVPPQTQPPSTPSVVLPALPDTTAQTPVQDTPTLPEVTHEEIAQALEASAQAILKYTQELTFNPANLELLLGGISAITTNTPPALSETTAQTPVQDIPTLPEITHEELAQAVLDAQESMEKTPVAPPEMSAEERAQVIQDYAQEFIEKQEEKQAQIVKESEERAQTIQDYAQEFIEKQEEKQAQIVKESEERAQVIQDYAQEFIESHPTPPAVPPVPPTTKPQIDLRKPGQGVNHSRTQITSGGNPSKAGIPNTSANNKPPTPPAPPTTKPLPAKPSKPLPQGAKRVEIPIEMLRKITTMA